MLSIHPRPRLALTLGDPTGIGPEVILKALGDRELSQICDITIIGNRDCLHQTYGQLCSRWISGSRPPLADLEELNLLDVNLSPVDRMPLGQPSAASGAASFEFLEVAIARTLAGEFDGIVTGPIAKSAWKQAGHVYPGQTELLAERARVQRFGMLFVAESPYTQWTLRAMLATTHLPLRQVPTVLSPALLAAKLDLLVDCLSRDFGIDAPRIAIAGLNPHSGEQGQLGHEEQEWLIPWLEQERSRRPQVHLEGPIPPDTLWVKPGQAWYGLPPELAPSIQKHDAYLALYHDQGLIPVKLLAFNQAVNTTIGLPFIRTSPDHGTAFDIAGQGIADATSLQAAIRLAVKLVQQRRSRHQKNSPSPDIPRMPEAQSLNS